MMQLFANIADISRHSTPRTRRPSLVLFVSRNGRLSTSINSFTAQIRVQPDATEKLPSHVVPEMPEIHMNWQGRYRSLDKNCPALLPALVVDTDKKDDSEYQLSKVLTRATQQQQATKEGVTSSQSIPEQNAMKILFGEEIRQEHITLFTTLKRLIKKWRARAAQRKNIIAAEQFATDDIQKRAIVKHKELAMIELPMPINWAIKEEVLSVLQNVAKVYRKEFGNNHKLTLDAKKRIEQLTLDLSKP